MQFLEPHMKYRITENIEQEPPDDKESKTLDHDVSTSHSGDPLQSSPPRKRRAEPTSDSCRPQYDGDALDCFFNFMSKTTREMPAWMQTQVKKKIFAVVIEAEEQLSSSNQQADVNNEAEDFEPSVSIKTEDVYTEDSCDFT